MAARLPGGAQAVLAFRPNVVLELRGALPGGIQSGWVFVLRSAAKVGAERHRIAIGPQNLVSLSFHNVPAEALIEETPVGEDLSVKKKRLYHAPVEQ